MATPPPGVWGIDVGQCALKAIRLETIEGTVTATAFDYIEHPKILSQPDADPDELTREALQQFLSRNKIKGDIVVISVPGQSGLARFVKLPPVEEKKIADIVKFEAKQQIPFPLEEVVWDFQKIGAGVVTDGFAMETEIGLFAMKRDMVSRAIQQFKDVNVEVHIIQMAPLALVNFVAYDLLNKDGMTGGGEEAEGKECVVALDIGTDNSNLVITDGEKIIWQRPIPLGGNHFTRALTKDMKLTFAKAEHLKRNAVKSPDLKKILASLKTVLNDFVGEVQRSLGYFTNTHRDAQIQYMVGLGNAFRLPGLQKYLQEKLQLEVRKLTELQRVGGEDVIAQPNFTENLMSFSVAVGAALQGLQVTRLQTNLLPHEVRFERMVRAKKPWAAAAAAALLLAVAGLTFGYSIEKATVDSPAIADAMKKAEEAKNRAGTQASTLELEKKAKLEAEEALRKLGSGVRERFNWQVLHQYVNMSLPRPNGDRLAERGRLLGEEIKATYHTKKAKDAYEMLEKRRFANEGKDPPKALNFQKLQAEDEFIKKHLIQVNVEGVTALYTEDLPTFFKNIFQLEKRLPGMDSVDRKIVEKVGAAQNESEWESVKKDIPPKAWVVEIRGYTYNIGEQKFIEHTILENLANPNPQWLKEANVDEKLVKEMVRERVKFLVLFKNDVVPEPVTGTFVYIGKSTLKSLLKPVNVGGLKQDMPIVPKGDDPAGVGADPAKPSRDNWTPIGDIARGSHGDAGLFGGGNQFVEGGKGAIKPNIPAQPEVANVPGALRNPPRTEFVILFVWNEALLEDVAAAKKE